MTIESRLTFAQHDRFVDAVAGLKTPAPKQRTRQQIDMLRQIRRLGPILTGFDHSCLPSVEKLRRCGTIDWDLVRSESICRRQVALTSHAVPSNPGSSMLERVLNDDLMKIVMDYLAERDVVMLARTSKSVRANIRANQKTWRLGEHEFGFYLPHALPSDVRKFLKAGENLERPGPRLVVTGQGPWVEGVTCEEVTASSAPFDTDIIFANAGKGALNLFLAAMQIDTGCPVKRPRDNQSPSKADLQKMNLGGLDTCRQHFLDYDGEKSSPYLRQFGSLRPLLISLDFYGNTLRHVVLHAVPFLDEQVTAVIVENLPRLEELSIQSCELLHFGTVLRLLDVVYWNGWRRWKGSRFVKFDMYPKEWAGPVENRQATAVLSHGPLEGLDTQRAVLSTVLFIAMKAEKMGLDILSADSLLCQFLELVPMPLGLMPTFLNLVREYTPMCSLVNAAKRAAGDQEQEALQEARHELLQLKIQIFGAMTVGRRSKISLCHLHPHTEHVQMWTCCLCDHKANKDLFPPGQANWVPGQRTCFPCLLRNHIDSDDHAFLREKREVCGKLFERELLPLEEDYDAPSLGSIVATTVENPFVMSPPPHAASRGSHWLRAFASRNVSKPHKFDMPWWRTALKVRALDSKRRFSEIGLRLRLDSEGVSRQPHARHYPPGQRWEAFFEEHLIAQIPKSREFRPTSFW